jgi:hypothetical protein
LYIQVNLYLFFLWKANITLLRWTNLDVSQYY